MEISDLKLGGRQAQRLCKVSASWRMAGAVIERKVLNVMLNLEEGELSYCELLGTRGACWMWLAKCSRFHWGRLFGVAFERCFMLIEFDVTCCSCWTLVWISCNQKLLIMAPEMRFKN